MLSHFNMQINNPCVVLNQDESKEFLKSDSFEDKYKFFMGGSLLDTWVSGPNCNSHCIVASPKFRVCLVLRAFVVEACLRFVFEKKTWKLLA